MTASTIEVISDSDRELEMAVHATARPEDAGRFLVRLLAAFDNRRRKRETAVVSEASG